MRKIVFILILLLEFCYIPNSLSQTINVNTDSSSLFANQSEKFYPDYQKTSLINREDSSEGFPFLSGDGLRLYFTQTEVAEIVFILAPGKQSMINSVNRKLLVPILKADL